MKDLFSKQADTYAKYRPGYPQSLIDYILGFVKNKQTAWDCATGNGQAASLLAPSFEVVEATDISEKQLSRIVPDPRIHYSMASAEKSGFPSDSFDLITVAQAYHWFQFDEFFQEATRVGKKGAIVAVWGYGLVQVNDETLNQAIRHFYAAIVGKYWDPERRYVDEEYRTIPFLFAELPSKNFRFDLKWDRETLIGYLNSWSSVQHFIRINNENPVDAFDVSLRRIWTGSAGKNFSFPLFLRLGIIEK